MLRNYVKGLLFLVSYIPLFLILLIQNFENEIVTYCMVVLIVFPAIFLFLIFRKINKISGDYFKIEKIENVNKVGIEYFVTYVIPFLNFNLGIWNDAISLGILLGLMCFMYIKTDLIYMNPILTLIGYNIFKVLSNNEELMMITRKKRNQIQDSEELIHLGANVLIVKNWEKK